MGNFKPVFLNDFDDDADVFGAYDVNTRDGINILIADYVYADWSGSSKVIFERDGKYYEVHGSHCSCYGLEGQWDEEEVFLPALRYRMDNMRYGKDAFDKAVVSFLEHVGA